MDRQLKKIWICNDVWMDILPFFERVELVFKLALISPRFDALVNTHFNGQSELTLWRHIRIHKELAGPKATLSVRIDDKYVDFPWPDHPLPNKIRFKYIAIEYIDHSVIEFLRANKQIWDRGTYLYLNLCSSKTESNVQPIWDIFVRQIWPIFTTTTIHHLSFQNSDQLDNLLRLTSPTILTDLKQLRTINSYGLLFPDALVDDDGPNAATSAGQALSKWLHIPRKDGQPKRLRCINYFIQTNSEWINKFKETFLCATSSVSYKVNLGLQSSTPIESFVLVNDRTKEKLTMEQVTGHPGFWVMKRCPIGETAAADQWDDENSNVNLNNIHFKLNIDKQCIGPLSPPSEEKDKEDQSNEKVFLTTPGPSDQQN